MKRAITGKQGGVPIVVSLSFQVPKKIPGGVVINLDVATSLDVAGHKWVSFRDVSAVCGIEVPKVVKPDDILTPVYFEKYGGIRAGIHINSLQEFFNRIGYSGRFRFALPEAARRFWMEWVSKEGASVHPLHVAYVHVLNTCVEPAIDELLNLYDAILGVTLRPPEANAVDIYRWVYRDLLKCIGLDSDVDFEDLTVIELTRLISVMTTFSTMLVAFIVRGVDAEDLDFDGDKFNPNMVIRGITQKIAYQLGGFNEMIDISQDIIEDAWPDWPPINEIKHHEVQV